MSIKSFKDFITEELGHVRHKKVNHIDNDKKNDGSDKDLEKEAEDYLNKNAEDCPRCGEDTNDCKCEEEDPWSTQNYHRAPLGDKKESKPKQEFKK